jgi:predicted house-cleaning noncanonical NTP pyrophosphatase (MazG superfamily)
MRTEYNKLIRDRIPEMITRSGKTFSLATLSPAEFARALAEKLVEEAQEACSADRDRLLEELADLSEVIDALLKVNDWEKIDLVKAQEKRRQESGGFDKRVKLLYVDDPSSPSSHPQTLAAYIQSIPTLFENPAMEAYDHMGAVLTDAILQAGLNYEAVVLPRVQKVQSILEAKTTSGFLSVMEIQGADKLLKWTNPEKPNRLLAITRFFQAENIETTDQLREWLKIETNSPRLKQQRGVGDKTADYFKILVGLSTSAIDRHIFKFLDEAGMPTQDYQEAQILIHMAADIVGVDYAVLDHNLWKYMSKRDKEKRK